MWNKGIALPIEYIVVIIICVVTLLAVLILFGLGTGGCNELITRTDLVKACSLVTAANCADTSRTILLYEVSALPFDESVWQQLDKINENFKCVKNNKLPQTPSSASASQA